MTPDERKLLQDLADKIAQTPSPQRDPEAEDFIRGNIGKRPDALYLMTQTVVIQNIALQQAQQQIQDLQQRTTQPVPAAPGGSFLGGGQSAPRGGYSQGYSGQQYAPPPPQYAAPSPAMPSPGIGGGGFLRGAAQTAAGVAAGTLAADAIASMFGHHGGGWGGGGFGGGGFGAAPQEEIVENNYYDAPPQDAGNQDYQDAGDQGQYDDGGQLDNADYDSGDTGGFDNSGDNFV